MQPENSWRVQLDEVFVGWVEHPVIYCRVSPPPADQPTSTHFSPNVAKAGGLQSQGVKGEVVVVYLESLTTQDLKFSGFPAG
jgi:hypothetical protein